MKISFFICSLFLLNFSSFAQYIVTLKNEDGYLKNANGSLIEKTTAFVEEGASSVPENNCVAALKTRDGKVYNNVDGRIDLKTDGFIYTFNQQDFRCLLPIEQITFDSCDAAWSGAIFKTGYPSIDKQNERSPYQVLLQGKATLLKHYALKWQDLTPFNSTNTTRVYTRSEQYYLYLDGKMAKLEKNRDNLASLLDGSAGYISKNKLNPKKDDDLINVVAYYNSL